MMTNTYKDFIDRYSRLHGIGNAKTRNSGLAALAVDLKQHVEGVLVSETNYSKHINLFLLYLTLVKDAPYADKKLVDTLTNITTAWKERKT